MIAQFFSQQIDFIVFVSGMAFIVLFVTCLNLFQEQKQGLPWIHLMLFALIQGLTQWGKCLAISIDNGLLFSIIHLILTIVSLFFLLEFGRIGLKKLTGKSPNRWIHVPLLICVSLGGFFGIAGLEATTLYVYGLGGGLWVSYVLYRASRIQKSQPLTYAALLMVAYAITAVAIVPTASFFPASLINQEGWFNWVGVPIELFIGAITLILSFMIRKYYEKIKQSVFSEDGSRSKNFFEMQFILLFMIFLFSGWGLAEYAGNLAVQSIHDDILERINLTKNAISSEQFMSLTATTNDEILLDYVNLRQKLIDIKESDPHLHDVYLMILKEGWIYFAADGQPFKDSNYRVPGLFYESPPPQLVNVFSSRSAQIIGPYSDDYGTFISGYTAIRNIPTNKVVGVFGIDINASDMQLLRANYRLLAFALMVPLFFIFMGFYVVREKTWESAQRIAASEKGLTQAQTIARIGSWTWSFISNHLTWSEEMYRIFGTPMGGTVQSFMEFQEFFSPDDWILFISTVQKAIEDKNEFELESKIIRPDKTERYIVSRGKLRLGNDGKAILMLGISQDITEKKNTDEKVQILIRAIEQSAISVVITNPNGLIEYVNPKFCRLTGYSLEEAIGQNPRILKSGDTSADEYARLWKTIQSGKEWICEFHNKKKNGDLYWESAVISPILDENGKITHYVAVKEDITERKQASAELQRAHSELEVTNRELEKASKVKGQFLANMSHEIRTPLNAIIGMTGLLLDTSLSTEQHNFAETVRTSGELLLTLINDILDFSKIEAQKMELENQVFDLRQCIEESLDLIVTKASQKKIELAYRINDDLPSFLIGDITRLRQILVNLLSNAVKFTESGEVVITVNGQLRDQHRYLLHFSVRDTGLGIPPDRLDRLFQSFSQIDTSTTRRFGGTGLGLAISKQLSELMGGTMWVESTGIPGQGSTFHFTILAQEAPHQEPSSNNNQEPVDLNGLRIMIVDDNPTNREILLHYTESWKMLPTAVGSGQEALDLLSNKAPFDLAILDFQMPEMDGMSLAKEIHTLLQKNTFPLVLLSSIGYREAQGDETCFDAYLTKPIKPSQLYDVLGTTINRNTTPIQKKFNAPAVTFDHDLGQHHPLRVLLVEDNTVNQTVAISMLGKIGYRADIASNGVEALQALHRQSYDLVFMDGQMPVMDGAEATIQIRQQLPPEQQPHIVAMTANAMQGDRERYLSYGMDDYISKPIRMQELVRAITITQPLSLQSSNTIDTYEKAVGADMPMNDLQPAITTLPNDPGLTSHRTETEPPAALNPKALQEFQEMMGDDGLEMVANFIRLYLEDSQGLIERMQTAFSATDCDTLRREAHTLKGNSNQIGAEILASQCAELEKLAKAGSTSGANEWIEQIQKEFVRVKAGLDLIQT